MPIPGQLSPLDLITSVGKANPVVAQAVLNSQNWLSQSFDLFSQNAGVAITSQTIHTTGIPLVAGQVITNVLMANLVAAVGTLPTSVEVGLVTPDGKVAVKSANTLTSLAQQGLGVNAFALTAPYTVTQNGVHFAYFLQNGTFGTTQPTPVKSFSGGVVTAGQSYFGNFGTSQTVIPAVAASVGTYATTGSCYWFGVN